MACERVLQGERTKERKRSFPFPFPRFLHTKSLLAGSFSEYNQKINTRKAKAILNLDRNLKYLHIMKSYNAIEFVRNLKTYLTITMSKRCFERTVIDAVAELTIVRRKLEGASSLNCCSRNFPDENEKGCLVYIKATRARNCLSASYLTTAEPIIFTDTQYTVHTIYGSRQIEI